MKKSPLILVVLAAALFVSGCGVNGPEESDSVEGSEIVIGSQQYYSNEIIAELYAQVLENAGYDIRREYQIGQREVYLPELEDGAISLLPEYLGNLVQYYNPDSTSATTEELHAGLEDVLPDGLIALDPAEASDQDSYTVTAETAQEYGLETIGDLANLPQPITVGANSEFETRPYGLPGLQEVYGVTATLTPIEDSGSALTVRALIDQTVDVANIYTASPAIVDNNFVVLDDPESMILPQNVVPIVTDTLDAEAQVVINEVSTHLSPEDLQTLNSRSVNEQLTSAEIASDWLKDKGLI